VTVVFTELASGFSNVSSQTYETGSFTIAQNELILVGVVNGKLGTPGFVTLAGHGQTWVEVENQLWDDALTSRLTLLRAMKSSGGSVSDTLDVSVDGSGNWVIGWIVVKVTGVTTGANGADAVVQAADDRDEGTALVVDMAPFANSANTTYAFFGHSNAATTITPGAGYTASTQVATAVGAIRAQWFVGVDQNPTATTGAADYWAGIVAELESGAPGAVASTRVFGMIA